MNIHPNSALGQLERLYNVRVCPLCLLLGGVNPKPNGKVICLDHMSQSPEGFKCPIYRETDGREKCGYKQSIEGECPIHKLILVPYWRYNPDYPEFLKDKKRVKKIIYAQLAQGRGKERGLETLDRLGEIYSVSGFKILELVDRAEGIERLFRQVKEIL